MALHHGTDPYLNTDAGTMSPFEHGEVFVLDDGGEVVPHITDAIQDWIERASKIPVDGKPGEADVCVIELGGTIGDIESMPFIEALGQFAYRVGPDNFCLIHVSLVPVLNVVGEQALEENVKVKLSQFCHVSKDNIITLYDVPNIWHIPLLLRDQKAHEAILKILNLQSVAGEPDLEEWTSRAEICDTVLEPVRIAMVGKYTGLSDSYLSVLKALVHATVAQRKKLLVDWVPAGDLEDTTAKENPDAYKAAWKILKGADGVLVPGGFGDRGVQGKILAAKYARENRIPYLGICLGMQTAVIEFARSVLGLRDANSTEFDNTTKNPCVIFMPEGSKTHMGGTMRLGSRKTYFQVMDCKSAKLYGNKSFIDGNKRFIDERHRHRYEVNPEMVARLESAGLSFTGKDETGQRMEIVELRNHPYFIGVQFHPEFKSRPGKPSPLFSGLIAAACGQLDGFLQGCENKKTIKTIASNDIPTPIMYQNGGATTVASIGKLDGIAIYTECNGVH
ncbi:hypothetical protein FEM48_Zijuj01G0028900 [Ziziphus jujuba var. spinosa]|uniref:CTP synthase n=1 Tax=Ziziphus jujuba var. spinosa TaxID=714518 RepID=A0A978VYQ7_ZIZJJ|nr:hypothetical protein FEM48_Zijuj01G0028900 [Ziziphus jujuba var. spinosa]